MDNKKKRLDAVLAQQEQIYQAWESDAQKDPASSPNHMLCFDLSDDFARQSVTHLISMNDRDEFKNLKELLSKPPCLMVQSLFFDGKTFLEIVHRFKSDFQLKPNSFCVIYFGYGGLSVIWFPIHLVSDGQHRRRK